MVVHYKYFFLFLIFLDDIIIFSSTDEEWFDDFEVVLPVLAVVSGLKPYGQMLFSLTLYFGSDQPVRLAYILGFRSRASCPYGANYIDASSFSVYFGILPFHL